MAFVRETNPDDLDQNQSQTFNNPNPVLGSGATSTSADMSSAAGASTGQPQGQGQRGSGSGFTNLQKYLNANQQGASNLAGKVAGDISGKVNEATEAFNPAVDAFGQKVQQGTNTFNQNLLNQAAADPSQYVANADVQKQLSGTYAGPQNFAGSDEDLGLQKKITAATDTAGLADTVEGRTQLLRNLTNPNKVQASTGSLNLNQYFLQNSQPAYNQIATAAAGAKPLEDRYKEVTNQAMDKVKAGVDASAQTKQQALSFLQNKYDTQLGSIQELINQREAEQNANAGNTTALQQALQSGNVTPELLAQMNVTPGQWAAFQAAKQQASQFGGGQVDLANFLQSGTGGTVGSADVLTDAQKADLNALGNLIGQQTTYSTGTQGQKANLDLGSAMGILQNQYSAGMINKQNQDFQKAQQDQAAAQALAQQQSQQQMTAMLAQQQAQQQAAQQAQQQQNAAALAAQQQQMAAMMAAQQATTQQLINAQRDAQNAATQQARDQANALAAQLEAQRKAQQDAIDAQKAKDATYSNPVNSQYTPAQVNGYIYSIMNKPNTLDSQKSADIRTAMINGDVSIPQVMAATGRTYNEVINFLQLSGPINNIPGANLAMSGGYAKATGQTNPNTLATQQAFNGSKYLIDNPDVAAAMPAGTDPNAFAYQHWLSSGFQEGRTAFNSGGNRIGIGFKDGGYVDVSKAKKDEEYYQNETESDSGGWRTRAPDVSWGELTPMYSENFTTGDGGGESLGKKIIGYMSPYMPSAQYGNGYSGNGIIYKTYDLDGKPTGIQEGTGGQDWIGDAIMTAAKIFIPGGALISAAEAIDNQQMPGGERDWGKTLGGVAQAVGSGANLGGYSDIANYANTAGSAINAYENAQNGNYIGAVSSAANAYDPNSDFAKLAGAVNSGQNLYNNINNGNFAGAAGNAASIGRNVRDSDYWKNWSDTHYASGGYVDHNKPEDLYSNDYARLLAATKQPDLSFKLPEYIQPDTSINKSPWSTGGGGNAARVLSTTPNASNPGDANANSSSTNTDTGGDGSGPGNAAGNPNGAPSVGMSIGQIGAVVNAVVNPTVSSVVSAINAISSVAAAQGSVTAATTDSNPDAVDAEGNANGQAVDGSATATTGTSGTGGAAAAASAAAAAAAAASGASAAAQGAAGQAAANAAVDGASPAAAAAAGAAAAAAATAAEGSQGDTASTDGDGDGSGGVGGGGVGVGGGDGDGGGGSADGSAWEEGGHITGPGTGTSDSIPARLSNGEYVIKASVVKKLGKAFFDHINSLEK